MMDFLDGAGGMASMAVALWFLRFWRDSGDRLLAFFAVAFFVLGANRIVFVATDARTEGEYGVYVVRAAAYALIIWAIVDRNRRSGEA